jgi:hypothetical protein
VPDEKIHLEGIEGSRRVGAEHAGFASAPDSSPRRCIPQPHGRRDIDGQLKRPFFEFRQAPRHRSLSTGRIRGSFRLSCC